MAHEVGRAEHRREMRDAHALVCRDRAEELVGRRVVDLDKPRRCSRKQERGCERECECRHRLAICQ